MLKTGVSTKCTEGLKKVKPHQEYLGRYLIFLIVGLLQSTLICLGDLLYLGIQCKHPFLFMLAGWFSSIVYVNIIYTLTVSFGDIGKAVSVVLLVMQVAGSGGTFPIEVAPAFFKAVYPLLPFVHSMAAFREAGNLPAFVIDSRTASAQTGNPDERGICRKAGRDKDYVMITCIYCSFFLT